MVGAGCIWGPSFRTLPKAVYGETVGYFWELLGSGESQVCDALPPALAYDEKLPPDQAGLGAAQQLFHPVFQTLCLH